MMPVAATPQRRARDDGGNGGQTPNAKRPASLDGLLNQGKAPGPKMNEDDLNNFIYRLYFDAEAMKTWAFTVNEAVSDHAGRLDAVRFRAVMEEMGIMKAEIAQAQEDSKTIMTKDEENTGRTHRITTNSQDYPPYPLHIQFCTDAPS